MGKPKIKVNIQQDIPVSYIVQAITGRTETELIEDMRSKKGGATCKRF